MSLPASVTPSVKCGCEDQWDGAGGPIPRHQTRGASCAEGQDWHQVRATRRPRWHPCSPLTSVRELGVLLQVPGDGELPGRDGQRLGRCPCRPGPNPLSPSLSPSAQASQGPPLPGQARARQEGPHKGPPWVLPVRPALSTHGGPAGTSGSSSAQPCREERGQPSSLEPVAGGQTSGTPEGRVRGCGPADAVAGNPPKGHTHLLGVPG